MMKIYTIWNLLSKKITGRIPESTYQTFFRRDILQFFYHVISNESLIHIKHLYSYKSPAMFEHDLDYLIKNYTLISYNQFEAHLQGRYQLKPNSVLLSFDDGCRECFTLVRPILLKYRVPCTFFITTDLIDNQNMVYSSKISMCIEKVKVSEESWKQAAFARITQSTGRSIKTEQEFIKWIIPLQYIDRALIDLACETLQVDIQGYLNTQRPFLSLEELRTLASDGFTIGAHSKSHPLLERLSEEAIENEIVESCQIIREITQVESIPFAFPYHGNGLKKSLLRDIRSRNKVVGYYFGTNGIEEHKGLIFDRIWVDAPDLNVSGQSNLSLLLNLAYQDMVFGWLRKYKHYLPTYRNNINLN